MLKFNQFRVEKYEEQTRTSLTYQYSQHPQFRTLEINTYPRHIYIYVYGAAPLRHPCVSTQQKKSQSDRKNVTTAIWFLSLLCALAFCEERVKKLNGCTGHVLYIRSYNIILAHVMYIFYKML